MENKTFICQLCLEVAEDVHKIIGDNEWTMVKAIIPNLVVNLNRNSKVCQTCLDKIETFYTLKRNFFQKCNPWNNPVVNTDKKQPEYIEYEECCFCIKIFERSQLADVVGMIFEKCFQELKSCLKPDDLKSCNKCLHILDDFCIFVITCTNSARKIAEYCSSLNIHVQDVNLYEIYRFLYGSSISDDSKNSLTCAIKLEDEESQLTDATKQQVESGCSYIYETNNKSDMLFPTEMEMFTCQECTFQTTYKSCLKKHSLSHKSSTEVEMLKCQQCTFETKYKDSLRMHSLRHKSSTEVESFKCQECTYKTRYKWYLKRHILRHKSSTEVEMFRCQECTFTTKYKGHLKMHTLSHKSSAEVDMFKCQECMFETKYKQYLRKHLLSHKSSTEAKIFKCQECAFQTKHKQYLKKHMLRHKQSVEVEMFRCRECTFDTKYKEHLKAHTLSHKISAQVDMINCQEYTFQAKFKEHLKTYIKP